MVVCENVSFHVLEVQSELSVEITFEEKSHRQLSISESAFKVRISSTSGKVCNGRSFPHSLKWLRVMSY